MRNKKLLHPFEVKRTAGMKHATLGDTLFITLFCLIAIGIFKHIEAPKVISPVQAAVGIVPTATPIPTATPTPTPKLIIPEGREAIAAYIKEVFGEHADKAFLLLSCENSSLNPEAVNTAGNHPAGSRDTGVFQINEYWQQVQYKFLLNYKVNIEIAYQIYQENGYSFERWTCGRKYGI